MEFRVDAVEHRLVPEGLLDAAHPDHVSKSWVTTRLATMTMTTL